MTLALSRCRSIAGRVVVAESPPRIQQVRRRGNSVPSCEKHKRLTLVSEAFGIAVVHAVESFQLILLLLREGLSRNSRMA